MIIYSFFLKYLGNIRIKITHYLIDLLTGVDEWTNSNFLPDIINIRPDLDLAKLYFSFPSGH